ncbi:hypothetical protein PRUPE_4G202000 [Prunus persica]|uniref:Uncharacterized protein n=1 Tax=Prunus persica TaxID=3760 RepID=A0A251PNG1_PRUPE|nr:hypothetical protein PRUPE_4G202000 [Prunus persica]
MLKNSQIKLLSPSSITCGNNNRLHKQFSSSIDSFCILFQVKSFTCKIFRQNLHSRKFWQLKYSTWYSTFNLHLTVCTIKVTNSRKIQLLYPPFHNGKVKLSLSTQVATSIVGYTIM